ncbi:MAG TPA: DnaJ domain-containing protein [Methyloceanibacter sp.]|jgi:DnaJ domain|nr:DnaJ domain-containing protein [Methyloceanibacter sp.]
MAFFLVGCALLVLLLLAGRGLAFANTHTLAVAIRKMGGVAALAAAGFLILRGALPLAIPLAVFGFSLLRRSAGFGFGDPFGSARKEPGQKSRIKTDRLEVELDHDSGRMEGKCLAGRFAGRSLAALSDREAMELLAELHREGAPEAAVMEAYLDWRLPDWREQRSTAGEKSEAGRRRSNGAQRMSAEEAYAVLGIGPKASEEEIRRAHRRLMMKMHPDQGGSNYLAARINEAKEVLLGRL